MSSLFLDIDQNKPAPLRWFVLDGWKWSVLALALVLSIPLLTITSFVFQPGGEVWQHLVNTVLQEYVTNSLYLMLGVAFGTFMLGVSAAWLVTMCEFPFRRSFEWLLLLPMAMPAYIIAYTYTGLLDFSGPVQSFVREITGWGYGDYWFPEIRSLWGAMLMLSLVLYPYVYLMARTAFLEQSRNLVDASRTLGAGVWKSFFTVSLPLARPAIVAGMTLALMETLADYGTVQYFGISTFTTGIFRTWFGLGDSGAAAQLSAVLMGFVFMLVLLERWSRRQAKYFEGADKSRNPVRYRLSGAKQLLATVGCIIPLLFGFLVPALQLAYWAFYVAQENINADFFRLAWHSIELAGITAFIAVILGVFIGYGKRLRDTKLMSFSVRLAALGYAIPGTVIAVGVMLPFAWLDNSLDQWSLDTFGVGTGLLFSGTLFILIFAYLVRFMSVSIQSAESGLAKIRPSMDDAARALGRKPLQLLREVHVPMMRGAMLSAALLVFVDVMKELPATLILRPFNFNTLAVRAFELAGDERLADSAPSALAIVVFGILPVILLSRSISRRVNS